MPTRYPRSRAAAVFLSVALSFSGACVKTEPAEQPDGYLVKVSLASNFNSALIERVRIVIDKSRWGQPLALGSPTSVTTTLSAGVAIETRLVSIDADSDTEHVIEILQNPFKQARAFQVHLASPGHSTRSFSVTVSFVHARLGTIGSMFKDQLPNGDLLSFAPGKKRELSFDFACDTKVSCLADGGGNQSPVLGNVAPSTINIKAGALLRINVAGAAYDRDGDDLTYAVFGEPTDAGAAAADNASIDSIAGLFTWMPTLAHVRDAGWGVTFSVTDGKSAAVTRGTTINVRTDNSDPVWSPVGDKFAVEGQTLSVPLGVYDPDNEAVDVTLDSSGLPAGANAAVAMMDGGEGTFTWTPTNKDGRSGPYAVKISARDGADAAAVLQFGVEVVNVNDLPVIALPESLTLKAGVTTVLIALASDPDGDLVTLAADLSELPQGPTWNGTADPAVSKSGSLTWNPAEADVRAAPYVVAFTAIDTQGGTTVSRVSLTVTSGVGGNAAPTISGPAGPQAEEGKLLLFAVAASDPEGTAVALSMDAGGLPVGHNAVFAVSSGTGAFTWIPAVGTARGDAYRVTFSAADTADASTNLDVFISVIAPQVDAGPDAGEDAGGDGGADAGDGCPAPTANPRLAPNDAVNAIVQVGCTLYIGGEFRTIGPITGRGAPLNSSTGGLAGGISNFLVINNTVYAVAPDDAGGWYIGGDFTKVGNVTRNKLARINADGTLNAWDPNASATVRAIAVSGSTVYVGGDFISVGAIDAGVFRYYLAAIGSDGVVQPWNPSPNGVVNVLAVSESTVYVGGQFTMFGGATSRRYLAAIDADGGVLSWNPNVGSWVYALAVLGSTIYAGGIFWDVGGITRNKLAAIDADGGLLPWDPNANDEVRTLAVSGSTVYAGGHFTSVADAGRNYLAAIGTDGVLQPWNPNPNYFVNALAVSDATVYAGGNFSAIGGAGRFFLAAIDTDGGLLPWSPNPSNIVNALAVSGSTVYAGGSFLTIGGMVRNRLAAIGTDGTLLPWNPNANIAVRALAAIGSTIYAGGNFTTLDGGTPRNYLAAIGTDGVIQSWDPSPNGLVRALAVSGATVFAGGEFWSFDAGGDVPRNSLAAIDSDGGLLPWNPSPNLSGSVYALAASGSTVYAGGLFTAVADAGRNYLAAIEIDGVIAPWNPNANNAVYSLAVSGSTVYAGGGFTAIGGVARYSLAAIDADGGLLPWISSASNNVEALAVSGSTIYAGGVFALMLGTPRNYLAAIGTDGLLKTWDPNPNNRVYSLAVSGSTVYAGGGFTQVGGQLQPYFAPIDITTGLLK